MSESPRIFSWPGLVREFSLHLPIWFVYLEAIGLTHAALANFPDDGFAALGIP
ncbi:MAG: hypothetical protein HN348_25435, partial [Proteobacteria bacterium]|nr:hypothetical protein [Pseudomonadota bacterium]